MAPTLLSLLGCLLLHYHHGSGAPNPGQVFLSGQASASVLVRQKRYNTGMFEEFMEGNLERECVEERCDLEEAREFFENDEKTMEYWSGYGDGDQCKSSPCQNEGVCKDQHSSFTCRCLPGFIGRTCEIATAKRCDVNNGDCVQFCTSLRTFGAKCSCAEGYILAPDGLDCLPEVEFPCGRDPLTVISAASTRSLQVHGTTSPQNITLLVNLSTTVTTSASTAVPPVVKNNSSGSSPLKRMLYWAFGLDKKRIVGGEDVIPGEIPWQVALISLPGGRLFCGGSILSELFVITAAHCLEEGRGSFYIRAGDHNIFVDEGREQNLLVAKEYIYPRYDASVSLYNHDIALLRLQSPIKFSVGVRPVCLGPKAFTETLVKVASPSTVSGWGRMRFLGAASPVLQKVELPYVERLVCKESSSDRITRFMFCAGYPETEKDSCQGDSGGPHASRFHNTWFLTGIVSWGEECAKEGKYGVYTRVSHYYRWIRKVMNTTDEQLALDPDDEPDP